MSNNIPPNQKSIQLELIPTGKSEQALNWRSLIWEHAKKQDEIYNIIYKKAKEVLDDDEADPEVVKKIKMMGDTMRGAGSWLKQVSEALQIADQAANDAIDANSWHNKDLEKLTKEEIEQFIKDYA